jgi:EF hand domain-containing protein
MRRPAIAAALLLTALSYPAFAQTPADHNDHHPGSEQVPMQTTSPSGQAGWRHGMMDEDMMDEDMMSDEDMPGAGMMGRGSMGRGMGRGMMGRGMMGEDSKGSPMMFRMIFALMDADGDGTISLTEFQAAHERIFRAMDGNKDGKLTPEEMRAFMHGTGSPVPKQ